jgi:hypothetical protein
MAGSSGDESPEDEQIKVEELNKLEKDFAAKVKEKAQEAKNIITD